MVPTYGCVVALQMWADGAQRSGATMPSLYWQLPAFVFVSFADVLTVPAALELAYSHLGSGDKGLSVSLVYLSQGLGNIFDAGLFALPLAAVWQFVISLLMAVAALAAAAFGTSASSR